MTALASLPPLMPEAREALARYDSAELRAIEQLLARAEAFQGAGRAQLISRAEARLKRLKRRYDDDTASALEALVALDALGLEGTEALRDRLATAPAQVARLARRRLRQGRQRVAAARARLIRTLSASTSQPDAEVEALSRQARALLEQEGAPRFLLRAHRLATALALAQMRASQRGPISKLAMKQLHRARPQEAGPYNPTTLVSAALADLNTGCPAVVEGVLGWAEDLRELARLLDPATQG